MVARRDPPRAGVFVDFDGTLAPIVEDPAAARPHDQAVEVLGELAQRWGRVAVISGRPAGFLLEHLSGRGSTEFHGLYGMERAVSGAGAIETDPDAERWRGAVAAAAAAAEGRLGATVVERKGLTVTLHYRSEPALQETVEGVGADLAARYGLVAHHGKMSTELRPPVAVDKGTVVRHLAAGLAAIAFAGDDLGDVPALEAMAAMRAEGAATLSIASGGAETPLEVVRAADLTVDGPDGIMAVLRQLAAG
jgi:trehalose 6-phosphate phosphatase